MKHYFMPVLIVFLVMVGMFFSPAVSSSEERKPVTIAKDSPLSLRVLTRPKAVLYADASEAKPIEGQLPVFKPYFVYTRPGGEARATGTGWYEVGVDEKGKIAGWIKSSDVVEWKQTICLSFSHPEGRKPVLMFEEEEVVEKLVKEAPEARDKQVQDLYTAIDKASASAPLPDGFPVISIEPKLAVDITKQFYLLPIIDHKSISLESYEGRLLNLVAVSGKADASREKSSDIRTNAEYTAGAKADQQNQAKKLEDVAIDVVWVMDTTRSMQPYIEEVRNTLGEMSKSLGEKKEVGSRLAFGLWAYRDSVEIKDIEYLTKNFTPQLQSLDVFINTLQEVKETKTDSVDVHEDVFAGVHDAITKTAWRPNSLRIIILVGDAPAHEAGHKWNSTKLNEKTLRTLATENKVSIFAIHVTPKIRKKYNKLANRQFKELALNIGAKESAIWSVKSADRANFITGSKLFAGQIAEHLETVLATAKQAPVQEVSPVQASAKEQAAPTKADKETAMKANVSQAMQAAMVQWLGSASQVEAPNDIEAWVTDKDLLDPSIQALEVRMLISKRQLDSLAVMLNDLITAGAEAQMGSGDFFTSLQSVSATAARNADKLANAKSLQDSGLVPAFLQGLPYESQIMTMSAELWESFGPDEQDQFIENLRSKVAAYQSLHDTPDQWVALNVGDAADDYVAPIPLELLP